MKALKLGVVLIQRSLQLGNAQAQPAGLGTTCSLARQLLGHHLRPARGLWLPAAGSKAVSHCNRHQGYESPLQAVSGHSRCQAIVKYVFTDASTSAANHTAGIKAITAGKASRMVGDGLQ